MSYSSKITRAIGYDRLDGAVEAGNVAVDSPTSVTGPYGNAGGGLQFDGTNDGAILQPRDLPRNFAVPGDFTCTGLDWDADEEAWWVGDFTNSAAKLIDPDDFSVIRTVSLGFAPQGVKRIGADIWVTDNAGSKVRKFNKTTTTEDTGAAITLDFAPNAVTVNGSGNLLIVDDTTKGRIHEYTTAGVDQGSVDVTVTGYQNLDGIHWVDASTLYATCDNGTTRTNEVLVVDPSDGSISARYAGPSSIEDVAVRGSDVYVTMDDIFHENRPKGNRVLRVPLTDDRDFAMACWVKTAGIDGTEVVAVFGDPAGDGKSTFERRGIGIYLLSGATTLRIIAHDGVTQPVIDATGLNFSDWVHVAVSVNATTGIITIYIDGVSEETYDASAVNLSYLYETHRMGVAHMHENATNRRWCSCSVADLGWWDETISGAEAGYLATGSEPTFTDPGDAALDGSTLRWGGSGASTAADWDDEGDTITAYSVVVKQDGTPVGSPDQALSGSIDISGFGSGDYTVEQTATNGGGESATATTPAVTYTAATNDTKAMPAVALSSWWDLTSDSALVGRWSGDGDNDGIADAANSVDRVHPLWVGPASYTDGPFPLGNAVALDGGNHLRIGSLHQAPSMAAPRTISLWARPELVTANRGLLSYADGPNGGRVQMHLSGGQLEVEWGDHTVKTTGASIAADAWTHFAVVVPADSVSTADAILFVNGIPQDVATISGSAQPLATAAPDLRIGASSDETDRFVGAVWDARIYSRALALAEITEESSGPEPRPIGMPRVALNGQFLAWQSEESEWNRFDNGALTIAAYLRKYGKVVAESGISSPLDGSPIDLSPLGIGVFDVLVTATNSGGGDPTASAVSNAVSYPLPAVSEQSPTPAGVCRTAGAEAGAALATAIDSL